MMRENFAMSLGCATIGPISSHLRDPLTSFPICGIRTSNKSAIVAIAKGMEMRFRSFKSTNVAQIPAINATPSHIVCLRTMAYGSALFAPALINISNPSALRINTGSATAIHAPKKEFFWDFRIAAPILKSV